MASVRFQCDIKAEKANAMRKFETYRKFQDMVPVVEVVVAVALLFWYSTCVPAAVEMVGKYMRRLSKHGLFVFAVVNTLVILIFSISSRRNNNKPEADIYEEYFSVSGRCNATRYTAFKEQSESDDNKQIDPVSTEEECNIHETGTVPRDPIPPFVRQKQPKRSGSLCEVDSGKQNKDYRRTRSERLGSNRRAQLRRCSAIDDLSNEEFRIKVESFIASKKMTLLRENINSSTWRCHEKNV